MPLILLITSNLQIEQQQHTYMKQLEKNILYRIAGGEKKATLEVDLEKTRVHE